MQEKLKTDRLRSDLQDRRRDGRLFQERGRELGQDGPRDRRHRRLSSRPQRVLDGDGREPTKPRASQMPRICDGQSARKHCAARRAGRGGPAPAAAAARARTGGGALCGALTPDDGRTDRSAPIRTIRSRASSFPMRRSSKREPGERADPIGDDAHSPVEGIVHRYPDRVLLKLVHVCPVYCRFCFRREMVGPGRRRRCRARRSRRRSAISRAHPRDLGGDPHRRRSAGPVAAPAARGRCARSAAIEHVKIVRVHTRVPVGRSGADHGRAGARAEGAAARRPMWCCTPTIRAN